MGKPSTTADLSETATSSDTVPDHESESATVSDGADVVTRRSFGKTSVGLVAVGIGGGTYAYTASHSALAASGHGEWVARGTSITATDGSVDGLTFGDAGDEDDELHLSWSGLNEDRDVNVRMLIKGVDDGDADGWDGGAAGAETDHAELARAEASVVLDSASGSDTYSWREVFDAEQPVDVDTHPEIDVPEDFSADGDGETRERFLKADVEVWIDGEDGSYGPDGDSLGDRKSATATISVTREEPAIAVEDLFAEISETHRRHRNRPREARIAYEFSGSPNVTVWARDGRGTTTEETICHSDDGEVVLGDSWSGNNTGDVAIEVNIHDDTCHRAVLSFDDQQNQWVTAEWEEDWSETCEGSVERDDEC